jgi:hypothetical protein
MTVLGIESSFELEPSFEVALSFDVEPSFEVEPSVRTDSLVEPVETHFDCDTIAVMVKPHSVVAWLTTARKERDDRHPRDAA